MNNKKINDLVAEKVMGFVRSKYKGQEGWGTSDQYTWYSHFNPIGDISYAWKVIEKVNSNGFRTLVKTCGSNTMGVVDGRANKGDWLCNVIGETETFPMYAKTVQTAICLAALKSVGVDVDVS